MKSNHLGCANVPLTVTLLTTALGFSGWGAPVQEAFEWAHRVASTSIEDDELAIGMALDELGNVHVTGWFDGNNDFGGVNLTSNGSAGQDIFVAKYDPQGRLVWVKSAGGASADRDGGRGIGLDSAGNVYVTGEFVGSASFDGITLSGSPQPTEHGFFLAQYDPTGRVQWVREGFGQESVYGTGMVVDGAGNSYVVGYAANGSPVNFQVQSLANPYADGYSAFVVKYDSGGVFQWARLIGGPGETYATKLALDNSGKIYIRGSFNGSLSIGSTTITASGSNNNLFLAKLDEGGTLAWLKKAEADNISEGGVAVDPAGNLYVTGAFAGQVSFDGVTLRSGGARDADAFLAKYTSAGVGQWAVRGGGTGPTLEIYWDLALDSRTNIYAAGVIGANSPEPQGTGTALVAKYDSRGVLQWSHQASGPAGDPFSSVPLKVAVDRLGNCYMAGWYQEPISFGSHSLPSQGFWNFFLVKLASDEPTPPVIVTSPEGRTVNEGDDVSFAVVALGSPPLHYQWRREEEALPGATQSVYQATGVRPQHAGNYTVVVTNAFGAVTSAPPAVLTIRPLETELRLTFAFQLNQLTLIWPAIAGAVLESTDSVSLRDSWSDIQGPFQTNDANIHFTLPTALPQQFFRLRRNPGGLSLPRAPAD